VIKNKLFCNNEGPSEALECLLQMTPDGNTWKPSETVEEETVLENMEQLQEEQGKREGKGELEEEETVTEV
jgi:hypothetical protein